MRKFLIVVAVLAALGAVLVVLGRRERRQQREERAEARLLQFDDRRVTGVRVTFRGTPWRFEKRPEGWRVTEPVRDAASESAVAIFVASTWRAVVSRVIEDPEDLAAYGLQPPVAKVEFEGVEVPALELGSVTPTGQGMFARVEGRPGVLVLANTLTTSDILENPDPNRLRDPSLCDLHAAEVTEVDIEGPSGPVGLAREGDEWWIVRPRRLPAEASEVERLLNALEAAQVKGFLDGEPRDDPAFGLGPGAVRISLHAGSSKRRMVLGAADGEGRRVATRDDRDTILVVDASGLDSLPLDVESVMSRNLSSVNRYLVTRFSYRSAGGEFEAVKQDDSWVTAEGESVPEDEVYGFLVKVLEIPVSGWRDAPGGSRRPMAALDYELRDGRRGRVEFLSPTEGRLPELPDVVFRLAGTPPAVPEPAGGG